MDNDKLIFGDVAYSKKSAATFKLNAPNSTNAVKREYEKEQNIIASWGGDNLRPQNVFNSLAKLPQAKQIISWQAKTLYSGGLVYGTIDIDDKGNEVFTRKKDKTIDEFFKQVNINRYLLEACIDYYWFGNPVDEILVDKTNRSIIGLASQDSSFFRLGLQDKQTGKITTGYLSANWADYEPITKLKPFNMIDAYGDRFKQVKEGNSDRYLYHRSLPTPGSVFYGELPWHNLIESGWLEVAQAIPAFKKALFKNQITIKYHIEIANWYWEWKYENEWAKFTPNEKRAKIKEELDLIESSLSGADNTGKSVKSLMRENANGGFDSAVKITAIDDKIKSGIYIEDSQEAFSNILFSYGVDPTLVGNAPGKNMGGGSGSDKRIAYNIYILSTKADQDLILEPLNFIRDYNGWDENIVFMFKNYYIATLEEGKEVSKTGGV